MIKVSIITVCLNAQDTIKDSIESVANQTYPYIEHIVIDGGSTDNTLKIIKKFDDKIDHLISEPDEGIFNAMNKGIKMASGDVLYFLNANDYIFDADVISDVAEFFDKHSADMAFGDMSFIEADGTEKERRIYSDVDKLFYINECVCHQGIFYKKEVFEICGLYDESYKLTADYDKNLDVILKHKLKARYMNRIIAKFTLGGRSNSNQVDLQALAETEKNIILNKYYKSHHFKMNKILNKTFRSIARSPKLRRAAGKIFGFAL